MKVRAWRRQEKLDKLVAKMTPEQRLELEKRLFMEFTRTHGAICSMVPVSKDAPKFTFTRNGY